MTARKAWVVPNIAGSVIMHDSLPPRIALAVMTVLALLTALVALRYVGVLMHRWPAVDPSIRSLIERNPMEALTHLLVAPAALLLGPFQFNSGLRRRHVRVHRWAGRAYVVACVVGGAAGFATALHATGGPVASLGFGTLAALWVGTTLWAWRAALARDLALHQLLMRFSYAMTFGAVTLRLQIPVGFALGCPSYAAMSVWLAYTAWVPNVVAVALYSAWRGRARARTVCKP